MEESDEAISELERVRSQGAGLGAKGQGGVFPPAVLGGLLAQAYLISWEAFAGPVPAEARVQLLPGHVVLGGLEEELEWPLLGGQRPGHQEVHFLLVRPWHLHPSTQAWILLS